MYAYFVYGSTETSGNCWSFGVDFIGGSGPEVDIAHTVGKVLTPKGMVLESLGTRNTILKNVEKLVFGWNPVMKECPVIIDVPMSLPKWKGKVWRI